MKKAKTTKDKKSTSNQKEQDKKRAELMRRIELRNEEKDLKEALTEPWD